MSSQRLQFLEQPLFEFLHILDLHPSELRCSTHSNLQRGRGGEGRGGEGRGGEGRGGEGRGGEGRGGEGRGGEGRGGEGRGGEGREGRGAEGRGTRCHTVHAASVGREEGRRGGEGRRGEGRGEEGRRGERSCSACQQYSKSEPCWVLNPGPGSQMLVPTELLELLSTGAVGQLYIATKPASSTCQ